MKLFIFAKKFPQEAFIWLVALSVLAIIDPFTPSLSICPLDALGFNFCPGCGLGRSISYFLHGELQLSWATHPLGIVAFVLFVLRIIQLTINSFNTHG